VVVDDLDRMGIPILPHEANPPLIVDPDGMLAATFAAQRFQPIARRDPEVVQTACTIQQAQFSQGGGLNVAGQTPAPLARPNRRRSVIAEIDDHKTL
jgi:hypothetical protein